MHPEILRQLSAHRGREMQARARQARLARMAIRARRGRALPDEADDVTLPPIPDYVDGSFRTEPAGTGPAGTEPADTAPAGPAPAGAAPAGAGQAHAGRPAA